MQNIIDKLEISQEIYQNLNAIDVITFDNDIHCHINIILYQIDLINKKLNSLRLDPEKCENTLNLITKNKFIEKNLFLYYCYLNNII